MLTLEEMRILDRNLEFWGVSIPQLMERAGAAVAETIDRKFDVAGKRVAFVCGTGNNGGDGFVAARLLAPKAKVVVALAKPATSIDAPAAREAFQKLKVLEAPKGEEGVRIREQPGDIVQILAGADVVVDALLGTGTQGALREPYASLVHAINACGRPVVSVDIPSGLGGEPIVKPVVTVALHAAKEGMTPENSGAIVVADIGIPKEMEHVVGPGEFLLYPMPRKESHKGQNGRLLVIGGGPFTGAPALVGFGAYGIGVDVVHLATPTIAFPIVASFSPNFIVHPLPGHRLLPADLDLIVEIAAGMDAVVIGPGLGDAEPTAEAVRAIVKAVNLPMVIDADALTAVGKDLAVLAGRKGIVTPHAREFEDLSGEKLSPDFEERKAKTAAFAQRTGFVVLLKGPVDVVTDGARTKENRTGNPGMTVGGTGDVLAGVCGGLLAKGAKPFDAARMAAFANGYAGDLAFREKSYGLVATDVAAKLPEVLRAFLG